MFYFVTTKEMVHQDVTVGWVYEHYLTYLYLSIADSDCVMSSEELDIIKERSFKTFDFPRLNTLFKEVYVEFLSHTDEEKRNYIRENAARYLRTLFIRDRVIKDLEHVVNNDEDSPEHVMFRFIRKIINNIK